jgi:hypothetical protein
MSRAKAAISGHFRPGAEGEVIAVSGMTGVTRQLRSPRIGPIFGQVSKRAIFQLLNDIHLLQLLNNS